MAAAAGATGARSWLQAHHITWLTPRRLRAVTCVLCTAALGVSTIGLSGSSAGGQPHASPPGHAASAH